MEPLPDTTKPHFCSVAQYKIGYETGFSWDRPHKPAGPFVYRYGYAASNEIGQQRKRAEFLSSAAHKAWHRGFNAGIRARDLYAIIRPKHPRRNVRIAA